MALACFIIVKEPHQCRASSRGCGVTYDRQLEEASKSGLIRFVAADRGDSPSISAVPLIRDVA